MPRLMPSPAAEIVGSLPVIVKTTPISSRTRTGGARSVRCAPGFTTRVELLALVELTTNPGPELLRFHM